VDTPALAGCVPRLDRATEVLPQAVGDEATGSNESLDPLQCLLISSSKDSDKVEISVVGSGPTYKINKSTLEEIINGTVGEAFHKPVRVADAPCRKKE